MAAQRLPFSSSPPTSVIEDPAPITVFREVRQGQACVIATSQNQPVGISGLTSCIGVYFKPDPEHCFLAHVGVTKRWDFNKAQAIRGFRNNVLDFLDDIIRDYIPNWDHAANLHLMRQTLIIVCPWLFLSERLPEHEFAHQLRGALKKYMTTKESADVEWMTLDDDGWCFDGSKLPDSCFGFVIEDSISSKPMPTLLKETDDEEGGIYQELLGSGEELVEGKRLFEGRSIVRKVSDQLLTVGTSVRGMTRLKFPDVDNYEAQ